MTNSNKSVFIDRSTSHIKHGWQEKRMIMEYNACVSCALIGHNFPNVLQGPRRDNQKAAQCSLRSEISCVCVLSCMSDLHHMSIVVSAVHTNEQILKTILSYQSH